MIDMYYANGSHIKSCIYHYNDYQNNDCHQWSYVGVPRTRKLRSPLVRTLHLHLSLNREGRWDTTDDFTTSFLHFSLFSTTLWDLTDPRPVHFLMLSLHLFFCLPCFLPPDLSLCLARRFWPDLMNGRHVHATFVCVSLRWSGGPRVVQLSAGSWHGLPCW